MLSFIQFVNEDLTNLSLRKTDGHPLTGRDAKLDSMQWYALHHPTYGHVASLCIQSNDKLPLHKTKHAAVSVTTHQNSKVPGHEVQGQTEMGPKYKIAPKHAREILRTLHRNHPNIEKLDSMRLTGARQKKFGAFSHISLKHRD